MTTYDEFRHYEVELQKLNVPIYSLRHGSLRIVNRLSALKRYIEIVQRVQPDIVHSWLHYPNLIARSCRLFCPPHRLITAVRTQYSSREFLSEKRTQFLSDFRIVIEKNNPQQRTTNNSKPITTFIPNGIHPEFFKTETLHKEGTSTDLFKILVPARIDPRKGHQILLDAVHLLQKEQQSNLKITLIGDITNPTTQQQIKETIHKYRLESIIKQLSATNNILPHYLSADVTVLPSYSEGFPNVVIESLATGTPAIVSNAANHAEIIQHEINGWVFATGNSIALAKCLAAAIHMTRQELNSMGAHGRLIANEYSIERMVKQYQQLYERAISS